MLKGRLHLRLAGSGESRLGSATWGQATAGNMGELGTLGWPGVQRPAWPGPFGRPPPTAPNSADHGYGALLARPLHCMEWAVIRVW